METVILPSHETNRQYNIIKDVLILLSHERINQQDPLTALATIVSASETILKNGASRALFKKLLEERVVTGPELEASTGLSTQSVYRTLSAFEKMGIIERLTKARNMKGKPGPRAWLYGLAGEWNPEDVIQAGFKLESLRVPGMALVVNGTQMILDEYGFRPDGVSFSAIQERVRPLCGGYNSFDIADRVARAVSQKGLKVWRRA